MGTSMIKPNRGVDYETCQGMLNAPYSIHYLEVFESASMLKMVPGKDRDSQLLNLLDAVTYLDLTTLSEDDSCQNLQRLCHKATYPLSQELLAKFSPREMSCAAVSVCPAKVSKCVEILNSLGSSVPVAGVCARFPSRQYDMESKLKDIECCIEGNAKEIDIVIDSELILDQKWQQLYEEVKCLRDACEDVKMKAIIAVSELGNFDIIYKSSMICMAAGADFIKTYSSKDYINATLPAGIVVVRAIKEYHKKTGYMVGFVPPGGIPTSRELLLWQEVMIGELMLECGNWLLPELFRIGASSLLDDVERTIIKHVDPNLPNVKLLPYL